MSQNRRERGGRKRRTDRQEKRGRRGYRRASDRTPPSGLQHDEPEHMGSLSLSGAEPRTSDRRGKDIGDEVDLWI